MTGARHQSKLRRREQVLVAAEALFRSQGYETARIEEIAETSKVSIGTIYAYFGSKGGIMASLMQPVIDRMKGRGDAILESPPKRAADAVAAMYEAYRFGDDWKDHNLLDALGPGSARSDPAIIAITQEFESFISAQLIELYRQLTFSGSLNASIPAEDFAYLIYRLLTCHFEDFVTGRTKTYEETLVNLHRRLRQLFLTWVPAAPM